VPEAYFSPGMAGVDSAGIGEVIQNLIPSFIESMSSRGVLDYPKDRRDVIQVSSFSYVAVAGWTNMHAKYRTYS